MNQNASNSRQHIPNTRLRDARRARDLTQKEVADQLGIPDHKVIGRWERGEHNPQPHYRRALCELYGKSMQELGFNPSEPNSEAEPPAAEPEAFWNLPPVFTSLVDRDHDGTIICDLLKRPEVRLLTLTGPGGVGKTRLSIQIASEMRPLFASGVCFVALDAVTNPALVIPTIASALNIEERTGSSLAEQVKAALRPRQLLLLLDNFEQVATVALFLEELLAACPRLKLLVTSRVVLHLPAEQEFSVTPLRVPSLDSLPSLEELPHYASIALFVQRVQALRPTFQLNSANARAVAEVCTCLDGLPLAIELAAANAKLLPPQELLKRLSQHLQLPENQQLTRPERQQTLYNTIRWSYDLLSEREQMFFRRLSVFAPGFTLEAVQSLCSDQQEVAVLNLLNALLDKSLLQRISPDESELRFSMLESIRAFAADRLSEQSEQEDAQHAHALYYLALVERIAPDLKGARTTELLAALDEEQKNLRAALQWLLQQQKAELALPFCEAFGKFCGLRGYWTEEMRWLTQALDLPYSPPQQAIRARVLRRAGHLAYRLRRLTEARALLEESMQTSREVADTQNLAGVLSDLGRVLYRQSEFTAARLRHEESVEAARASGDQWSLANALEGLGQFMHYQGNDVRAYELLQESARLAQTLLDNETLVRILTTMVTLKLSLGDTSQAEIDAQLSHELAQKLGTRPLIALTLKSLADVALSQKDYARAAKLYTERCVYAEELGDMPTIAIMQLQLANIALAQGYYDQAMLSVRKSLQFFRAQGDNPNIAAALNVMAVIERSKGNL